MEINRNEFGSSYSAWGMKKSGNFRTLELGFVNLPEDPFCMNIRSTLNTISDWLHENQIGLDLPIGFDWFSSYNDFVGLSEVSLPEDPFCMKVSNLFHEKKNMNGFDFGDDDVGEPHDAFELVLPYLELKDVFAVEGVCRSLRDSVRKDPFFWRSIDLGDSELKYKVTDESLLKLTRRAQGHLQCLNLGGCIRITDNGLSQVLANNPRLTKLSVSGCHLLSAEGVLSTLRDLKSSNRLGVKSLITGGALYFTKEQFKELNLLLGADAKAEPKSRKKRFYIFWRSEFSLEDGRVTDLEICPRCEKPGMVFDCPGEICPLKDHPCPKTSCRACVVCIERCLVCGSCFNDCEHEPFCFAKSCVVCYKRSSDQLQESI